MAEQAKPYRPRCKFLTCKAMMVYGENFEQDPDYQAGLTDFWCVQTSTGLGPDGDPAGLDACSNPERGCYQEY